MGTIIPAPDALIGRRFDVAVAKMMGISRAKASDLIETGQATIVGRTTSKSDILQLGDLVEITLREREERPEPVATDMAIVYEDDDVVVVDKPVGVAAHASVGWRAYHEPRRAGPPRHRLTTRCGYIGPHARVQVRSGLHRDAPPVRRT